MPKALARRVTLEVWQILARQGQIAPQQLNDSWQKLISPFAAGISSQAQLFDVAQASIHDLWRAAAGRSSLSQGEVISLLAGPKQSHPAGQQVRQELANRI